MYAWDTSQAVSGYMYFLLPAEYAYSQNITDAENVDLSKLNNFQMKVATDNATGQKLKFMWYNLDLYDDGSGNPLYDATTQQWKEKAVEDAMQQGEFRFWIVKVPEGNTTFSLTKDVYKHDEPVCYTFYHWNWDYSKTGTEKGITPASSQLPAKNLHATLKTGFKYHFAFYLQDVDNGVYKDYFHLYVTTKSQDWDMSDNNQGSGTNYYRAEASEKYTYNIVFVKSDGTTVARALNPVRMHGSEDDRVFSGIEGYTGSSHHYLIYNDAELGAINGVKETRGFNYYYYNLSFKNDDPMFSAGDEVVGWYVERKGKDGSVKKLGPSSDTDLSSENDEYFYHGECTTVSNGHKTSESERKFQFRRGSLSYTISLDAVDEDHPIVRMFTNTHSYESKHTGGFYLVSCGPDGSGLRKWQSEALKVADDMVGTKMTPYYYKNGVGSLTSITDADSVVYKVHLERPTDGKWTSMRLLIRPADLATDGLRSEFNPSVPFFLKVIRPQMCGDYHGDTYRNSGAMENVDYNQYIELHPGDDVKAVNFTFNASYNTYRIEEIKSTTVKLYDIDNIYYKGTQRVITDVSKGNYRWYKAYSTSTPYYVPTDASGNALFDVYSVSALEKGNETTPAKITMKKVDAKVNGYSYIPANVGLVIAGKSSIGVPATAKVPNGNKESYDLTYDSGDKASTSYSKLELPLGELSPADQLVVKDQTFGSMLTPTCDMPVTINEKWSDGSGSGNNYVFGFYENKRGFIKDQAEGLYTLGYWLSTDNDRVPANSSYLHLTSDQIFVHDIGTSYYDNSQKAKPLVMFDFGGTTTDISEAAADKRAFGDSSCYYTLSGMRVNTPLQPGIYIHNGKKIIVSK